jgi:hypothetical protein
MNILLSIKLCKAFFLDCNQFSGIQILIEYNGGIRRNDQSLFHYGFVQHHDLPRLIARDLPVGNLNDPTIYTEEDYGEQRCLNEAHCPSWPLMYLTEQCSSLYNGPNRGRNGMSLGGDDQS